MSSSNEEIMQIDHRHLHLEEGVFRPLKCQLNILSRPDGSALFTMGNTGVLAAVYGPIEVRPQKILIDRANIEAFYRPKSGMPNVKDKSKEQLIKNTCEAALISTMHPRTCVSLILQEFQDYGGLLACCINAGMMALLNSGLPMNFFVAAVSCIITDDKRIIIDPSLKEMKNNKAALTFAFESISKNVVASHNFGKCSIREYQECLEKCRRMSEHIFKFYRNVVKKYSQSL